MSKIFFTTFILLLILTQFQIKCEEEEENNTISNETHTRNDIDDDDLDTPDFFTEDDSIDSIVQLSDANFSSFLKSEKEVYLFFYTPWCGYCHKFKPEVLKAADFVKNETKFDLKFAFVNAVKNSKIVEKFGVERYPTLYLFVNDKKYEYDSRRKVSDLMKFYERMKNGAILNVKKLVEIEKLQKKNPFLFISTIKDQNNSKLYESFNYYATKNMKYDFIDCTSDECIKKYGTDDIILLKSFDEKINSFNKDYLPIMTKDNTTETLNLLKKFYSTFGVEAGVELLFEDNILDLFENNKKAFFYFRDSSNKTQTSKDIYFKEFGIKLRNKNILTYVADIKGDEDSVNINIARMFLIESSKMPIIYFYDNPQKGKEEEILTTYRKNNVNINEINLEYLFKFYSDIKEGKILRDLASGPIPQEKEENGYKILIGYNYDEEVMKEKRNVALLFVGINFEVCQMYIEFFGILAQKYKDKDDIVFGVMDVTKNEPRDIIIEDNDILPLVYLSINDNKERRKIKFKPDDIEKVRENDIEKFIADNLGWKIEEEKKNDEKKEKVEKNNGNEEL